MKNKPGEFPLTEEQLEIVKNKSVTAFQAGRKKKMQAKLRREKLTTEQKKDQNKRKSELQK